MSEINKIIINSNDLQNAVCYDIVNIDRFEEELEKKLKRVEKLQKKKNWTKRRRYYV